MSACYAFFTTNEIKPRGWLRRQLEIQAKGLCGNLDRVWRDVRDSAWIGGDSEGWERVPYWLDGAIPLAYLLEDADLIVIMDNGTIADMGRHDELLERSPIYREVYQQQTNGGERDE